MKFLGKRDTKNNEDRIKARSARKKTVTLENKGKIGNNLRQAI